MMSPGGFAILSFLPRAVIQPDPSGIRLDDFAGSEVLLQLVRFSHDHCFFKALRTTC